MPFAEKTNVPVSRTRDQIERMVRKYGAASFTGFGVMQQGLLVQLAFSMAGRSILFKMTLPDSPQKERSIWRALLLTIKGKLESAERGIETFDEAFLANTVLPGGRTVSEEVLPAIEAQYQGGAPVPLLPPP